MYSTRIPPMLTLAISVLFIAFPRPGYSGESVVTPPNVQRICQAVPQRLPSGSVPGDATISGHPELDEYRKRDRDKYLVAARSMLKHIRMLNGPQGFKPDYLESVFGINWEIQKICRDELDTALASLRKEIPDAHATAVVMDPTNGRILAMTTRPGAPKSAFQKHGAVRYTETGEEADKDDPPETARLSDMPILDYDETEEKSARFALTHDWEPGSLMAPLIFAAALNEGLVKRDEFIDCTTYTMPTRGQIISDQTAWNGSLSAGKLITQGSNPGLVRVSERLGNEKMREYLDAFGIGISPVIEPWDEISKGKILSFQNWTKPSNALIALGYELTATTAQLARAYSVFTNGGKRPPRATLGYDESNPAEEREVISEATAATMRELLRETVNQGIGRKAMSPTCDIAGRPGVADVRAGAEERNTAGRIYSKIRQTSGFIGFAPSEAPRVLVAVAFFETRHGSEGPAAPVAARILERALDVVRRTYGNE